MPFMFVLLDSPMYHPQYSVYVLIYNTEATTLECTTPCLLKVSSGHKGVFFQILRN